LKIQSITGLKDLNQEITKVVKLISNRGEIINSNKLVAELTLGFWIRLFNAEYENILWKDLRRAFPFCPKPDKQRHKISAPLNIIRNFRNRIYHYEPISWNLQAVKENHQKIYQVSQWLNEELPDFMKEPDRFEEILVASRRALNL